MVKLQASRGFSLSEMLVAMSMVGILALCMLSLNNFTNNKTQVAQTKLAQVDTAIRSWGKAVSQTGENGLGARAKITDINTLAASLENSISIKKGSLNIDAANKVTMTASNGIELTAIYNGNGSGINGLAEATGWTPSDNLHDTPVAFVIANANVKDVEKETYYVYDDRISTPAIKYSGYDKPQAQAVDSSKINIKLSSEKGEKTRATNKETTAGTQNSSTDSDNDTVGEEETKVMFCLDESICGPSIKDDEGNSGCAAYPEACIEKPSCQLGDTLYVQPSPVKSACGGDFTGDVMQYNVATACGSQTVTTNTCCPIPTFYNDGSCTCNKNLVKFNQGEVFVKSNTTFKRDGNYETITCKKNAEPGTFAKDNDETLCLPGAFCDEAGMTSSKTCTKGHYCPNKTSDIPEGTKVKIDNGPEIADIKDLFHDSKFDDDSEKDGGLINEIICPPGFYCPTDGTIKPIDCPKGYYCPEGSEKPIPCPKGTYNPNEGQSDKSACKPCNEDGANEYQDKAGQSVCKECANGTHVNASATACIGCLEGEQYDKGTGKCTPCPAGTYNDVKNGICKPCESGSISAKDGAIKCTPCKAGTYQDGDDYTQCKACNDGQYQDKDGQTECIPCKCGTYTPKDSKAYSECLKCTGANQYAPKGSSECKTNTDNCKFVSPDHCFLDDKCPAGTYRNQDDGMCVTCPDGTVKMGCGDGKDLCVNADKCGQVPNETHSGWNACNANQYAPIGATECTAVTGKYVVTTDKCDFTCSDSDLLNENCECPDWGELFVVSFGCGHNNASYMTSSWLTSHGYQSSVSTYTLGMLIDYITDSQSAVSTSLKSIKPKMSETDLNRSIGRSSSGTGVVYIISSNGPVIASFPEEGNFCNVGNSTNFINSKVITTTPLIDNAKVNRVQYDPAGELTTKTNSDSIFRQWVGGNLKINNNLCNYDINTAVKEKSPIILDLKHNGLVLTNIENGVEFDIEGKGKAVHTAWTGKQHDFDDAFLVYDHDTDVDKKDGQITSGKEMFGDQDGEKTGYEELAKYDDNKDQFITPEDAIYNELQLWCDKNKNGKTDDGELHSLADENVVSISVNYSTLYDNNGEIIRDEHGNIIGIVSSFLQKFALNKDDEAKSDDDTDKSVLEKVADTAGDVVEWIADGFKYILGKTADVFFKFKE